MFQQMAEMNGQHDVLTQDGFRSLLGIIVRNMSAFNQRAYPIHFGVCNGYIPIRMRKLV
jgi:hypothetical protein